MIIVFELGVQIYVPRVYHCFTGCTTGCVLINHVKTPLKQLYDCSTTSKILKEKIRVNIYFSYLLFGNVL